MYASFVLYTESMVCSTVFTVTFYTYLSIHLMISSYSKYYHLMLWFITSKIASYLIAFHFSHHVLQVYGLLRE